MEPLKIALAQYTVGNRTPYEVQAHVLDLARQATLTGARLLVLPELSLTPYFPAQRAPEVWRYAEPVPGPTTRALGRIARECGLWLVVTLAEKALPKPYLTAVVIDDRGRIAGWYRKVHLPELIYAREKTIFQPGDDYAVVTTPFGTLGLLLCYDRHFPEAARTLGLRGADILVIPAAAPVTVGASWELELRAHAVANGYFVLAANRCGKEGSLEYLGRSCAIDVRGQVIVSAGTGEELVVAGLDPLQIETVRNNWQFYRDRRPETYGVLAAEVAR